MPCIYRVYTWYVLCMSNGLDIYLVYTIYAPGILTPVYSTHYIPCVNTIEHVYRPDILPIYSLYSRYIHSRIKPEISPGQRSLVQTHMWVTKRGLFHVPQGQLGQGKRRACTGLSPPTSPSCRHGLDLRPCPFWILPPFQVFQRRSTCHHRGACRVSVVLVVVVIRFVACVTVTAAALQSAAAAAAAAASRDSFLACVFDGLTWKLCDGWSRGSRTFREGD
jgi:hypothetical protein